MPDDAQDRTAGLQPDACLSGQRRAQDGRPHPSGLWEVQGIMMQRNAGDDARRCSIHPVHDIGRKITACDGKTAFRLAPVVSELQQPAQAEVACGEMQPLDEA